MSGTQKCSQLISWNLCSPSTSYAIVAQFGANFATGNAIASRWMEVSLIFTISIALGLAIILIIFMFI